MILDQRCQAETLPIPCSSPQPPMSALPASARQQTKKSTEVVMLRRPAAGTSVDDEGGGNRTRVRFGRLDSFYRHVASPAPARKQSGQPPASRPGLVDSYNPPEGYSCHAPPSTSGLGHGPFKAVARVRIPSGALPNEVRPRCGDDDFVRIEFSGERDRAAAAQVGCGGGWFLRQEKVAICDKRSAVPRLNAALFGYRALRASTDLCRDRPSCTGPRPAGGRRR
jgi:hypothetical protein